MFQHIPNCPRSSSCPLHLFVLRFCEISWGAIASTNEFSFIGRRIAPHQNYLPRTVPYWIPTGLDITQCKSGISLSDPHQPKPMLQILPPMLRMNTVGPIRSCSKAPGVFSSNYRYPASSPEVHFHRASPRDSSPVITPFVHVGTYPTRNCATLGRL